MKRLATWFVVLAIVAGMAWWQRATVVPLVVSYVPAAKPYLAKVPGLADLAAGKKAETAEGRKDGQGGAGGSRRGGGGGPVAVVLAKAETKTLPVTMEAVGRVEASASVAIRPRVDSQIMKVDVEEGALVKEGDLLFSLDDRTPRAQLAQIEAQISQGPGADRAGQARPRPRQGPPQAQCRHRGHARHGRDRGEGRRGPARGRRGGARRRCKTTLTYTEIRAPVLGPHRLDPEQGRRDRARRATPRRIATINQVDPIYGAFAMPQALLGDLRAAMAKGDVQVDAIVDEDTQLGRHRLHREHFDRHRHGDRQGAVPNARRGPVAGPLRQGRGDPRDGEPTIAVPARPCSSASTGLMSSSSRTASRRAAAVTVSRSAGADAVIGKGLKPGEEVVVDGQLRLVNGATVTVKPRTALEQPASSAPTGKS